MHSTSHNNNIAMYGKRKHTLEQKKNRITHYRIIIFTVEHFFFFYKNKIQLTLSIDSADDSCKLAGLWVLISTIRICSTKK